MNPDVLESPNIYIGQEINPILQISKFLSDAAQSPPLLLAAGHMNKFFTYPNLLGKPYYILKVTSKKEEQFYAVLHLLAKRPLNTYNSLSRLIGKEKANEIKSEAKLIEKLSKLSQNKSRFRTLSLNSTTYVAPRTNNHAIIAPNDPLLGPSTLDGLNYTEKYEKLAFLLLKFIPHCFETFSFELDNTQDEQNGVEAKKQISIIKMINLNYSLKFPLILDIKMGKRLHGDDASESKKARAEKKALSRAMPALGFSFSGMVGFNHLGDSIKVDGGSRSSADSVEENPLTIEQYAELIFKKFLLAFKSSSISFMVSKYLEQQLRSILSIMEEQDFIAFYGSSLLFVADTSVEYSSDISQNVMIRMIDFANVTLWTKSMDRDYVFGIQNLIKALKLSAKNFTSISR